MVKRRVVSKRTPTFRSGTLTRRYHREPNYEENDRAETIQEAYTRQLAIWKKKPLSTLNPEHVVRDKFGRDAWQVIFAPKQRLRASPHLYQLALAAEESYLKTKHPKLHEKEIKNLARLHVEEWVFSK